MARRQLQSTAADPSSTSFQTELRGAVASSFSAGITAEDVQVEPTTTPRVLMVTVTNAGTTSMDALVAKANSATFVSDIGARVGTGVTMHTPAAIIVRTVPVPAPPPSPPTVPSPTAITVGASSLAVTDGSTTGAAAMTWDVIFLIVAVIVAVIILGFCVAYIMGKRAARSKEVAVVGRPALRRQSTSEKNDVPDDIYSMEETVTAAARVDDVRLIELGMAVERTMQMQRQSSGAGPSMIDDVDPNITNVNVKTALENVQMALDEARESLSPRMLRDRLSPRSPRSQPSFTQTEGATSPRPMDTGKIRATSDIDF